MKKNVVSIITAAALIFTLSSSVLAEPLSTQVESHKAKVQQSKKALENVKERREDLEVDIEKMDNQIEGLMYQINAVKTKIVSTEKNINATEKEIIKAQEEIKDQKDLFDKRIRAMYVKGMGSYLDILVEADGIGEFISRAETVKKVMEFDKKLAAELKQKKEVIVEKKQRLDNDKSKLVVLKADSEKKLSEVKSKKNEQNKLLADLRKQERTYASSITESQSYINKAMAQIAAMQKQHQLAASKASRGNSNNSNVNNNFELNMEIPSNASGSSIVVYASSFLGRPYQWGGNGPSTFDCSGLVKYVYAQYGINLPRIASDQQTVGVAVSKDQLEPGDLVFFGYPAHHVGIYAGNNSYLHAPRTGDVVKISPLTRSDFSGGRRIIR
ncbi:cell wall-associated NlpC family hydrolase [Clostridium pascui]|uniref:C40 family peptidase n=1 Tax=Clostridium pascui TaxID=46609 RepID=UPI001957AC26|nr:C40 family peptidase [Clostridium pascui]MBM7870650.1 cell wall-associated NlpC family hydrolase [Clostridium pascui]